MGFSMKFLLIKKKNITKSVIKALNKPHQSIKHQRFFWLLLADIL